MSKLTVLVGIPGSGKSTHAVLLADSFESGNAPVIVNRDTIRFNLFGRYNTSEEEEVRVKKFRDNEIDEAIEDGFPVIVDDTNLHTLEFYRNKYGKENVNVIWMEDSFNLELCMKRNEARARTVSRPVVENMFYDFVKMWHKEHGLPYPYNNPQGSDAILIDLDGTVAKMNGRSPYDWTAVDTDLENSPASDVIFCYADMFLASNRDNPTVIFLSGRDSRAEEQTRIWLDRHFGGEYLLFMRKENDTRPDFVIKRELYAKHVLPYYNVELVFDDREQVVTTWKSMGLTVMQVHQPSKSNNF